MRLHDQYDGSADPFEGDRTIVWRSLPKDAVVTKATLTIEPRLPPGASDYVETLRFAPAGPTYGAAIRHAGTGLVEINFHARRTAIGFSGLTIGSPSALAVDIGSGVYLAVGSNGTIPAASGPAYDLTGGFLPGIGAFRLRLGTHSNFNDDLSPATINLASMPSNLILRFGKLPPFWSKTGELAVATTTPDITNALQRALADAAIENGFFAVPIVIHSDTLGRIAVTIEVDYLGSAPLVPAGFREVVLPYDLASVTTTDPKALQAMLPAGAAIRSPQTSLQIRGAFEASRVAFGPTGTTNESTTVHCSATETLAQPLIPATDVNVSAVDLFIAADGPAARLALDLRTDFDGKPSQTSLLAKAVSFDLAGDASSQRRWTSVPIAPAALLTGKQRIWVIVQALDGAATLGVDATPDPSDRIQRSTDAGFSWRLAGLAAPLLLRLRTVPDRFQMPIDFVAGNGAQQQRVSLRAYDALGKVDAVIDGPEIANAVQSYVAQAASAPCQAMERLRNPDFSRWTTVGRAIGRANPIFLSGAAFDVIDAFIDSVVASPTIHLVSPACMAFSTDGANLYVAVSDGIYPIDAASFTLGNRAFAPNTNSFSFGAAIAVAAEPSGRTLYFLASKAFIAIDIAARRSHIILSNPDINGARALILTPDGRCAYVASDAAILALDLTTGTTLYRIPIVASGLALIADGATLVAIDDTTHRLASFDTATGAPGWVASLPEQLVPRAIIADVNRAGVYAVGTSLGSLSVVAIDARGRSAPTPPVALDFVLDAQVTLALKQQGDRLYVGNAPIVLDPSGDRLIAAPGLTPAVGSARAAVSAVSIGNRQPSEWTLTAGTVISMESSDDVPQLGALLDSGSLSQVVAVTPSCAHDFAIESSVPHLPRELEQIPEAVAEVFWMDSSGTLLRSDSLNLPNSRLFVRQQIRLMPPAASAQAEVRIRVTDGRCFLRLASLKTSDSVLRNDGWRPDSAAAGRIVTSETATATTYRNPGIADAALMQTVALGPDVSYVLDIQASAISGASNANPYFELGYQDASGATLGKPQHIAIASAGFVNQPAKLTVPPSSTTALLRIVLPPAAVLVAERLQLVPKRFVTVPCSFIAQAPGELHVSNAQVVYDETLSNPPSPPAGGLSTPTPPDRRPGDPECDPCADDMPTTVASPPRLTRARVSENVTVSTPSRMRGPAMPAPPASVAVDLPLTSIHGIGLGRSQRLAAAGIATLRDLAAATPERVVAALAGAVATTPALASTLIERAKAALTEHNAGGTDE